MSTHRYPGGVISATPPTASASTAVGVWTLEEALRNKAAGNWPDGSGADPYFDQTTLLLHGDGTNGAQNNTFLDSSTNNFTITRNGNTTQGSFGPYAGPGCWSNYFDGTGDYLNIATSTAFGIGTGDFTIEYWVYFNSLSGTPTVFDMRSSGADTMLSDYYNGSGNPVLYYNSANLLVSSGVVTVGSWNHIVWVRSGTTITSYVNGVARGTATSSANFGTTQPFRIGANITPGAYVNGYISNFRFVKGAAVYTSAFTPSTTPLVATTQTVLLTCNNNGFIDQSAANNTLTRNGDTQVSKFSPFTLYQVTPTSYSGYFDGTGDYLTFPQTALQFSTNDFTVEAWVYFSAIVTDQYIFNYASSGPTHVGINYYSGAWRIGGFNSYLVTGGTASAGQWYHVAMVRSANNLRAYINGTQIGSAVSVSGVTFSASGVGYIGAYYSSGSNLNGSVSNLRITNGQALYTANFTPSTSPLTTTSQGATAANVSLLTCQSTTFIDNSTNAFTITVNGNATPERANPFTDTVTGPTAYATTTYGGSAYFDGTGDYLGVASNAAFAFGTGDFTIECWFLTTSSGVYQRFWWFGDDNDNTNISTGNAVQFGGASQTAITGSTIYTNNWYHLAYVRSSGSGKLYLNGAQVGSTTANSYNSSARTFYIGATGAGANPFFGYISNLRIVKGTAVYNGPFVPPTSPVTAVTNTQLLLNATNAGIFDNTTVNNLETVGAAQISTSVVKYGTGSMYFNGGTSYLNIPNSNAIMFGTGDFTIEGWFYNSASQVSNSGIFSYYVSGYFLLHNNASAYPNLLTVYVDNYGAGTRVLTGTTTLALNTWYYFAITRSSGVWRLFLNGTQEGSSYTNSAEPVPASAPLRIGYGNTAGYTGYIDDFRITKGYARYTANFTPPGSPFPNI